MLKLLQAIRFLRRGLERVVRRALAKMPEDRPADCDKLREELDAAMKGTFEGADHDSFETVAGPGIAGVAFDRQDLTRGGSQRRDDEVDVSVVVVDGPVHDGQSHTKTIRGVERGMRQSA